MVWRMAVGTAATMDTQRAAKWATAKADPRAEWLAEHWEKSAAQRMVDRWADCWAVLTVAWMAECWAG